MYCSTWELGTRGGVPRCDAGALFVYTGGLGFLYNVPACYAEKNGEEGGKENDRQTTETDAGDNNDRIMKKTTRTNTKQSIANTNKTKQHNTRKKHKQ